MAKQKKKIEYEQKVEALAGLRLEHIEKVDVHRILSGRNGKKFDLTEEIVHRIIARIKKV